MFHCTKLTLLLLDIELNAAKQQFKDLKFHSQIQKKITSLFCASEDYKFLFASLSEDCK